MPNSALQKEIVHYLRSCVLDTVNSLFLFILYR